MYLLLYDVTDNCIYEQNITAVIIKEGPYLTLICIISWNVTARRQTVNGHNQLLSIFLWVVDITVSNLTCWNNSPITLTVFFIRLSYLYITEDLHFFCSRSPRFHTRSQCQWQPPTITLKSLKSPRYQTDKERNPRQCGVGWQRETLPYTEPAITITSVTINLQLVIYLDILLF